MAKLITLDNLNTFWTEIKLKLNNKVDKVMGKGLSSNDYTNADKAKVDAIPTNPKYTDTTYDLSNYALKSEIKTRLDQMTSDSTHRTVTDDEKKIWNGKPTFYAMNTVIDRKIEDKVDKVDGKGLSTNDYTNEDKSKLIDCKRCIVMAQTDYDVLGDVEKNREDTLYFIIKE